MNRILRPILRVRLTRLSIIVASLCLGVLSFGQVTIENCPNPVTNIVIQNPMNQNCVENFSLANYPTSMDGEVRWYSTGATSNGDATSTLPITAFTQMQFNFGLSTVIFVVDDGNGNTAECRTIAFVSEEANLPTTTCDDVTVDLNGGCTGMLDVPYEQVEINTTVCDPMAVDSVSLSWSMTSSDPPQRTVIVDAHSGNPSFYSLYLRKYRDDVFIRQQSCLIAVTVENATIPELVCPSSETIQVAPGCDASYIYDVLGASTEPCNGSITQIQGDPSGTPLPAGAYPFQFDLVDDDDQSNNTSCTWTVTVEESEAVPTQFNCVGFTNISIDQNCEATIGVPDLLTGNVCLDPSLIELYAVIPGIGEVSGPTITFTDANVGQTIDVTVRDVNGLNSCWGQVTIEDKIGPAVICPADMTISCTMPTDTASTGGATLVGTNCEDVTIYFSDAVVDNQCNGDFQSVISRRFYAVDGAGNMGEPCTQTISIEREDLLSAVLPPHWDGLDMHSGIQDNSVGSNPPLSCDGQDIAWNSLTNDDGIVVPSPYDRVTSEGDTIPGTGYPGGVGSCGTIFSFYEDIIIDICEEDCEQYNGSYKVLRTWDVFDWCTGQNLIHQQIIKVVDTIAPEFTTGVPDLTVSTDLWGCGATIYVPFVEATDNCSSEITYWWDVEGGTYDAATNRVYVHSVAITEPGEEIMLFAYAEDCCGNIAVDTGLVTIQDLVKPSIVADEHTVVSLNNQSTDGHTKVKASSFDDGSFDGCGPIDFWVRRMDKACMDFDGEPEDSGEKDEINDFHKEIHFCCMDLEEDQMVVFMVCDDGDGDGVPEMNGDDNCNTAMISVTVQDKLAPTINCPADTEINCIDFVAYVDLLDTDLSDEDITKLENRFGAAFSNSTCGVISEQTFSSSLDEVCGVGQVARGFTVMTTNGTADCAQVIDVVGDEDNLLSCDRISFAAGTPEDEANYDWCDPADEVTPFVTPIQVFECGGVNILEPLIDRDGLCTEVGINLTLDTFNFAGGACVKILAHWEVIDQCFFEENFFHDDEVNPFVSENGYYELYVEYDIFDTDPPELDCDDVTVETADCEYNFDTFTITATDDCTSPDIISITYAVDFDNDGVYDYPADGYAEGNSFDAADVDGLPIGTHAIKWIAYDGCGNYETCHQEITVVKKDKAPTPYCHLGLSSAVMDEEYGCSVEMWATDFAVDSFDDCDDSITVLMIPYQDIYGKPADPDDDLSVEEAFEAAKANWVFGCEYIENGISHVIELRIYFVDEDGVYDFCDASLTLNDNFDCCEDLDLGGAPMITGNVATEEGVELEEVLVKAMTNNPEFPRFVSTAGNGSYLFSNVPMNMNYEVEAENDNNALQGVTTLDIVLIQRHILGIVELDSPYKIIAADVNNNTKVTAGDLLQMRKLILGLYADDKYPNNSSWRFVNSDFEFADVKQPFPFGEHINITNLTDAIYNQNFVGVKIGDVNGTVSKSLKGETNRRSDKTLTLEALNSSFNAGEQVEVSLSPEALQEVFGFQFGLSFDEDVLSINGVQGGSIGITEENFNVQNGEVRMSWNSVSSFEMEGDEPLFTISFIAKEAGQLSDVLALNNSQAFQAEAYDANLEIMDVEVKLRDAEVKSFELMQNSPNPFNANTTISFILPEAGNANLRVFDVTGKVLFTQNGDFGKGMNQLSIENKDLGASGIYYYQLTFGKESATKKMILLD